MIALVSTSLSFIYILFAANPSVRPWGAHDFLAVLLRAKNCIEVNGVKKASKTPRESAFDLFCVPKLSAARFRVKTAEFEPEKLAPPIHRPLWFLGLSEMVLWAT